MRRPICIALCLWLTGCVATRTYWVREADRPSTDACHAQCRDRHGDSSEFYACFRTCPNVETTFSAECRQDVPGICYERTELDGRPALVLGLAAVVVGVLAAAMVTQVDFDGDGM